MADSRLDSTEQKKIKADESIDFTPIVEHIQRVLQLSTDRQNRQTIQFHHRGIVEINRIFTIQKATATRFQLILPESANNEFIKMASLLKQELLKEKTLKILQYDDDKSTTFSTDTINQIQRIFKDLFIL